MTSNHKLTNVLKGRVINSTAQQNDKLAIGFADGSTMSVKTASASSATAMTGTVKAVRQQDTSLALDLEGGQTWQIEIAEATSSVMVRDKNHTMEYAD